LLCIIKEGLESLYTSEEVELVKAVAELAVLVMQWLHTAQEQTEAHARGRALQEVHQLSQSFFVLASHELRTPLTGILGNLQLVRRRLAALERQVATQAKSIQEQVALAQQPVASALQSTQLQQRIITDVIDDARLAANQFQLHFQPCDLLALVHRVVGSRAQVDSGHVLQLKIPALLQMVFVLADAERIARVLTTYLENALAFSPAGQPVTVGMRVEEGITRVWVHNEGAEIPFEEQEHLWERFYRAKGNTVQNELDLSLGLRLYLCRAFIERHGGQVGVQSTPGQGATFWFTLPRISQQREG
jgi:signal transduction histidine kinase